MKKIIVSLLMLLFLFSCSESEQIDYTNLSVGFVRDKMDVGENSKILEIPVTLSGCNNGVQVQVVVDVTSVDKTAVSGTDFELLDKQIAFNTCGNAIIRVKIINNEEVSDVTKDFSLVLKVATPSVQTKMSTVEVSIINDDVKKLVLEGHYTLTAQNFVSDEKVTSSVGGVEIVKDVATPGHYLLKNMVFVNGANVFPMTSVGDLYFEVDNAGLISMPVKQDIGDYGKGEGFTIGLNSEGYTSDAPISIIVSGNKLIFNSPGIGGITVDDANKLILYYAFKNVVLDKIN